MQSKETKVFTIDGKRMRFDANMFDKQFKNYRRREKLKVGKLEEMLAEKLNISSEAVHNWRFKMNGPGDVDMIKKTAELFGLTDWTVLTKEIDGGDYMIQLTDRQKDAAKRIYDISLWFLNEFNNTDGFNDYWYEFKDARADNTEEEIYNMVQKMIDKVFLVVDQEYFDLHGHEIYDELYEFISEDLQNTYNDKLGYAYRFEAIPDGHPTTSEDYGKALKVLNAIIDKYI